MAETWEALLHQLGYRVTGDQASREQGATLLRQHLARGRDAKSVPARSPAPDLPEDAFLRQILTLAKYTGWKAYHTHDSRKSESGFPDLVLAKPGTAGKEGTAGKKGRLIFAECKRRTGKLTAEQAQWLDILSHTLSDLEVYTWRPADWEEIVAILGGNTLTRQRGGTG